MFEFPVLVGDIGGTNARFALVPEAGAEPVLLSREETAGHPDPSAAIRASLDRASTETGGGPAPRSAILAVAARVDGPAVRLTNADWVIEGARIGRDFGLSRAVVVNDYVPVAAGAAGISPSELTPIGPHREEGRKGDQGARLVLGPGTGFGAAALLPVGERLLIVSTESGHVDFGPSTQAEHALWPHLERVEGRVTVEALLSGPGLTRLHAGLHRLRTGTDAAPLDPAAVTEAGLSGADPDAAAALNLFAKFLGRVCGDLALTFLATGGVYIGGGIAPRILDVLQRGPFRAAFEHKPPFVDQMRVIPTSVIAVHDPALTGLAALASQPDRFFYHGQVWQAD
ncbi:glucokinase [Methylobacterium sp. J-068]|uniref:glucokinase n=1 Tax=Methylobacterium sp. J-068 TaxID=2836649 RepID=UPI001FBBC52B|nr:glucokinase [Methylobacterium sp. J-068]MCJ2032833.1 glucokinase [Methylobacterium sp. J-068]